MTMRFKRFGEPAISAQSVENFVEVLGERGASWFPQQKMKLRGFEYTVLALAEVPNRATVQTGFENAANDGDSGIF